MEKLAISTSPSVEAEPEKIVKKDEVMEFLTPLNL
jgi:hypothetical protein